MIDRSGNGRLLHDRGRTARVRRDGQERDDPKSRMTSLLNILEYASQDVSSMELDTNERVCIDLTADSGACDSVISRKGPCEKMKVYSSMQSERGLQYEVANAQTLPCLGERRLEVWTEGAESAKSMAIQVADVHKPLLSPSRCADMGF